MKFKIKINEDTTLKDIRTELENLKTADVIEIPLNHIRKITSFLGAIEVQDIGSSIRFKHQLLADHPEYHGYFKVHKIHKGGDQDMIRKNDFKNYLLRPLFLIIEMKEKV